MWHDSDDNSFNNESNDSDDTDDYSQSDIFLSNSPNTLTDIILSYQSQAESAAQMHSTSNQTSPESIGAGTSVRLPS